MTEKVKFIRDRSDERRDRARRHLQRPDDLLRRAPGVPQFTNTVKQLLRWHKDIVPEPAALLSRCQRWSRLLVGVMLDVGVYWCD